MEYVVLVCYKHDSSLQLVKNPNEQANRHCASNQGESDFIHGWLLATMVLLYQDKIVAPTNFFYYVMRYNYYSAQPDKHKF